MTSELKARRVADRIRVELSELLQYEVADPRLTLVTVTDVRVDRELAVANVWVSALGGEERQDEVLRALIGARGFLRREVAHRVELRTMPQLRFHWDPSPERAERISRILDSLTTETAPGDSSPVDDSGTGESDD